MTVSRKNYVHEIAAAHRVGDLDTLMALAIELAGRDAMHVAKLDADLERKRQRKRKGEEILGNPTNSPEFPAPSSFSPGPPFPPPTSTTASTAREASDEEKVVAAKAQLIEALGGGTVIAGLVERYALAIPDAKRYPWLTAMGAWLDPEQPEHYSPSTMIAAMHDWLIADRGTWPWEGRKFRSFMRDIDRQREPRNLEVVKGGRGKGRPAPQQHSYPKPSDSESDVKWQTR